MRFAKRVPGPVLDYATPPRRVSVWQVVSQFSISRRFIATALSCLLTVLLCYIAPPTGDWRINIAVYGGWFAILVWWTDGGRNWLNLLGLFS